MDRQNEAQPQAPACSHDFQPSQRERFLASYFWLILKNVIGWVLILLSFAAGPLVPGPGGIPLFLIGFALISFPGKRRLTARVLRGKPIQTRRFRFALICAGVAVIMPILALMLASQRPWWLARARADALARGPVALVALYVGMAAIVWVLVRRTPYARNLLLRITARARRKFRPWLRRHHIRLLPPRRRRRHAHEPGSGPLRLKDEILKFSKMRSSRD
jgi:hypothetical protein